MLPEIGKKRVCYLLFFGFVGLSSPVFAAVGWKPADSNIKAPMLSKPADTSLDPPTFKSFFSEKPGKTIDRELWYRFGPKFGVFVPNQRKLARAFKEYDHFLAIDFLATNHITGWVPSLQLFTLFSDANAEGVSQKQVLAYKHHKDRIFLTGPTFGYQKYFRRHEDYLLFYEFDVEYLFGKVRSLKENLNTGWVQSYGLNAAGGAIFADHYKLTFEQSLLRPVKGFNLEGSTFSLSYLFDPPKRW